ncbi:MAG: class I SAM-dependent methyltransferase [Acidobacteriota bacterium]
MTTPRWSPDLLNRMKRDWDQRALENARYYVATEQPEWSDQDFFQSGEATVKGEIIAEFTEICRGRFPADMRVLEIGCGAGRVTRALARLFGQVEAVDVSGEMIQQARAALQGSANVCFHRNNGVDLSMFGAEEFDFAFSSIVFQHIPSKAVVEHYIRETWRVLRPGSIFKFQVQGFALDEANCDTWVGVGFSEQEMRDIAEHSRYKVGRVVGAGTQYFWLTFYKSEG